MGQSAGIPTSPKVTGTAVERGPMQTGHESVRLFEPGHQGPAIQAQRSGPSHPVTDRPLIRESGIAGAA